MVQVLGRLALSFGIFVVAGLSGWLASIYSYETVFLLGLIVPAHLGHRRAAGSPRGREQRPIDWRILGGGLAVRRVRRRCMALERRALQPGDRLRHLAGRGRSGCSPA